MVAVVVDVIAGVWWQVVLAGDPMQPGSVLLSTQLSLLSLQCSSGSRRYGWCVVVGGTGG